ncbi:hypothetical protein GCM10025770_29060 [Viridibacterium curvum]|uniref:Uncharacterized protein n=1 Tax=Viridibacterium curvum TaxID=1101404 RepID=A0ABP9QWD5_9RHOO
MNSPKYPDEINFSQNSILWDFEKSATKLKIDWKRVSVADTADKELVQKALEKESVSHVLTIRITKATIRTEKKPGLEKDWSYIPDYVASVVLLEKSSMTEIWRATLKAKLGFATGEETSGEKILNKLREHRLLVEPKSGQGTI